MDNLRRRTVSGLGWSGVAQVARQLLLFVVSVILARLLGPTAFGLIGMVIIFTGFASVFSDLGLGAALIQKLNLEERHLNAVFWANIATGILLTAIVIAISPLIASFYNEPVLKMLAVVISVNFIVGSLGVVQKALLQKKMDFRRLAQIEVSATLVAGLVAVIIALTGFGVWSLVAQSLLITAITVAMLWRFSAWRPALSCTFGALRELLGFGANLMGFNVFNYWARNLDNLLIGKFIGAPALGIYARAYSIMLLPVRQISSVVSRVMFPALSSIQDDIQRVKRIYLRSIRTIALVTFPLMVGLLAVAEPFIIAVYGSQWRDVIPILQVFCLVGMIQSVGTTVGWIYTSQGRTDIMLKWGIFAGTVQGIAFVIGLRWGIFGVAMAYALSGYIILWYPSWTIPGRLINLRFGEMLKSLSGPFYCAAAMGGAVWALGLVIPSTVPDWARLAVQVLFGIALYFTLVNAFKIEAYTDARQLLDEHRRLRSLKGRGEL